jgi:inosine-uridine nucleoside N-ribohydrolase
MVGRERRPGAALLPASALLLISALVLASGASAQPRSTVPDTASVAPAHRIIFDTDFGSVPMDDAYALMLALHSPEIEIAGVTTVAGNFSLEQATADVLRLLEIAGREEVPVYRGADMPLVHEKSHFATTRHGTWWSDEAPTPPPGGFATKRAEELGAAQFIAETVAAQPGEITLVAIGPLTNLAMAMRLAPDFAAKVKRLVIMGGAIPALPDGHGNITPAAEFNFWVDPEAARIVLRSGIPIDLSPLNVSRKSNLTREWYERLVEVDTPFTRLIREHEGPLYDGDPDRVVRMYDQIAVASLIDPTLVETVELYVDVDDHHGVSYGASIGGKELWPHAEGAQKMAVQYDLDWERFMEMFIERVARPFP